MPSTTNATTPEDAMRGVAGGFVLGVPLVYTQEVWFHGGNLSPLAILGLLAASFLLILLRRINFDMGFGPPLGIIALSAVPISLGFALGNSLAPKEGGRLEGEAPGGFGDLLAAAGGAVILVLNIAPTEEPLLLAA